MKTKTKHLIARLGLATMSIVFSTTACVTATYAWLSNSGLVSATNMSIKIDASPDVVIESMQVFYWDDVNNIGSIVPNNDLSLSQYDAFIPSKNENNRRIAKFVLSFPRGITNDNTNTLKIDINLASSSSGNHLGEFTYTKDGVDYIYPNISNIIKFNFCSALNDRASSISGNNADEIYRSAKQAFKEIADEKMNFIGGTPTINATKSHLITKYIPNLPTTNNAIDQFELYMEYDYDQLLIELYNNNSEEPMTQSIDTLRGQDIDFTADIQNIVFSLQEEQV